MEDSDRALSAVGEYLKDRQYSDSETFDINSLKLVQSCEEMALNCMAESRIEQCNTASYTSRTLVYSEIDEQYRRFLEFIQEASEPFKDQLTHLLYPLFVNIYIEFVYKGRVTSAQKFFHAYNHLFIKKEGYKEIIEDLQKMKSVTKISNHPYLKQFREKKFSVQISEDCMEYLIAYLKGMDHLIILQMLNLYITIDSEYTMDFLYSEDEIDSTDMDDSSDSDEDETSEDATVPPVVPKTTYTVTALEAATKKVSESSPNIPSSYLYTVTNCTEVLSTLDFSLDNSLLAGGFKSSAIRVWSLTPKKLISHPARADVSRVHLAVDELEYEEDDLSDESYVKVLKGHSGPVHGVAFTPCQQALFSCSGDTTVRAWSMKTFKNNVLYTGHNYPIWDIDVSPYFNYFATASKDHTARIWSTERTYPMKILAGHNNDVDCVKFHPNCNYVATGSSDKAIRLWSVQDGRNVRLLLGHKAGVCSLAFSPNGLLLASADEDCKIKIWDLGTGSEIKELKGHTDNVHTLCFNRDSSLLASGGYEHSLNIWDVRQGTTSNTDASAPSDPASSHTSPELLTSLPTNSASLRQVRFNLKNLLLAAGSASDQNCL